MLKPIHRVACSPALTACQHLMQQFATWLCAADTTIANLTRPGLQPPALPSAIEADWTWDFLQRVETGQPLLDRARVLVGMSVAQKTALAAWVQVVSSLPIQFQPAPVAWPVSCPSVDRANWAAFKTLMEAFYDKGFRVGLPYLNDGTPVAHGGVKYAEFVSAFRDAHRLNPNPHAREVCVLCGGPLGDTPHVDHWIIKSAFPLLSMCADNLTLICSTCNEAPNKGDQAVYTAGSFADWFHPYLRPGCGALQVAYDFHAAAVQCSAVAPADQAKASNLDGLLNLANRWTREFKAEYAKHQDHLRRSEDRRLRAGQARHTLQDVDAYVHHWASALLPSEPHHEVHALLGQAMNEPARVQAWLAELAAVQ
jgi:hypothetical protein